MKTFVFGDIIHTERKGFMANIDYRALDLTGVFAKTVEGIDFDFEIPKEDKK